MSGVPPSQAPAPGAASGAASAAGPAAAAAPPAAAGAPAAGGGASATTTTTKGGKKKNAQGGAGAQGGGAAPKPKAARKKKPSTKPGVGGGGGGGGGGASSRQQLLQDAKVAQTKLQQHRALLAGLKTDPLWLYRIEDVLPSISEPNAMVGKTTVLPEQVQIIENAIRQTGLHKSDLSPQAMACLLEQARRYALELLTDAQDYAHAAAAGHSNAPLDISKADLLLAAEMRADHPVAISTQLPRLNTVATNVNRIPLPPLPTHCFSGVVLPPAEHQVTGRTYDLIHAGQVARRMVQETPKRKGSMGGAGDATVAAGAGGGSAAAKESASSSYGAARGRQIPIKLKATAAAAAAAPPAPAPTPAAPAPAGGSS